ncbi:GLOBIN domain-containing protein [Aphelenchoides besseyi]|nr:GLOBIN domain-containing protein [Aphelenchoides besseyi]
MCEFDDLNVRVELFDSLDKAKATLEGKQNGLDFYKFFFTNFPQLRIHFRGAEHYTADDVQKSERFEKQGKRLLLALHFLAASYDHPDVIKAYARELVIRHRPYKMTEGKNEVILGNLVRRSLARVLGCLDWVFGDANGRERRDEIRVEEGRKDILG